MAALALASCAATPQPAAMREKLSMGPFEVQALAVDSYSRAHQGVPWQVDVTFEISGGNRFERADFAERINHKRIVFRTAAGWRDRVWLFRRDDEGRVFELNANPAAGSHGYTVDLPNPYGSPASYRLDLGI